jgi:hypothetical protein
MTKEEIKGSRDYLLPSWNVTVAIVTFAILLVLAALWLEKNRPAAHANACLSNLESIEGSKEIIAAQQGMKEGDFVSTDMLSYVLKQAWPLRCPSGGKYYINPVGSNATCSFPGHSIP